MDSTALYLSGLSIPEISRLIEIGRKLRSDECVHHKDHNKTNNDPDNLQVMTKSEHAHLHSSDNVKSRIRDDLGRFL